MKKNIIIGVLAGCFLAVGEMKAQKITPAEINAGSSSAKALTANIQLDYTIGNGIGTAVLISTVKLNPAPARMATETDVEDLPEALQEQILSAKAGIKAWPVPSEGPVNLLLEGVEKGTEAQVFDQTGKLIQRLEIEPNEPAEIHLPSAGIYFIRTSNKDIPTIRLIQK